MPLGKRPRKVIQIVILCLFGILAAFFSVPLWFKWVFPLLARAEHLHYARYERLGYGRFALYDVTLAAGSARFSAKRVQGLTPGNWLWHSLGSSNNNTHLFLFVSDWRYEHLPSRATSLNRTVKTEWNRLQAQKQQLERWLPQAVFTNGAIHLSKTEIVIPSLRWSRGELTATGSVSNFISAATLRADLRRGPPYRATLNLEPLQLTCNTELRANAQGVQLQSTGFWWSNRVQFDADFAGASLLPRTASLKAESFRVPAGELRLPAYQDVTGSLRARWEVGVFALDLSARAQPLSNQTNLPPVNVQLHARGDTNAVTVETATVGSPWFHAELSREVQISFRGPLLKEPASFKMDADLQGQPWLPLDGRLNGRADLHPGTGKFPTADFHLSGSEVGSASVRARDFAAEGQLLWPSIILSNANTSFDDGSKAALSGTVDLRTRTVHDGHFSFQGPLLRRWLPSGYWYRQLSISGTVEGPLNNPGHAGEAMIGNLETPWLQPLNGQVMWRGQRLAIEHATIEGATSDARFDIEGALRVRTNGLAAELASLSIQTNGLPLLALAQPCTLAFSRTRAGPESQSQPRTATAARSHWQLQITPLWLKGLAGEIRAQAAVQWPQSGMLSLNIQGLTSAMLSRVSKRSLPELEIRKVDSALEWSNGPARLSLALFAKGRLPEDSTFATPLNPAGSLTGAVTNAPTIHAATNSQVHRLLAGSFTVELAVAADQERTTVSNLVITSQGSRLAQASGYLPLTFDPTTTLVELNERGSLQFTVRTATEGRLWDAVADWTGLRLRKPQVALDVSGSWRAPKGALNCQVAQVQLMKPRERMPTLEDLQLHLELDNDQARLTNSHLRVQGQPVRFSAELPLDDRFWADVKQKRVPDLEKTAARIQADKASLAAFEPLFPKLLAPQGEVSLKLTLAPGGKLGGQLAIQHARTHPLGAAGPLRDINISMLLVTNTLDVENASAELSSAAINLSGEADLRSLDWLHGSLPPFQFVIQGTNVPLARQPEYVVRSDLLLAVTRTNGAAPLITGVLRLHDSFYLSELHALVPGSVEAPRARPPYFSIEDPLLADWRMAVEVQGDRFLKVRSPLFNGEISSALKLQGTLKDPIVLGDLKIDSGVVRFPFGSLAVQQGLVNLTSQDPYHPQLSVMAASKQFGYDIRMQVTGPVDSPVIQFTSNPPLSSEQILLMVTAGEMPQGNFNLTPQQRAQTVALFFGRDVLAKLGFGDQTQQRLTIRSGEEISEQGRPTYHVEYKLTDRWSLEGEYDRFGDYNAGFKWRVYSK